MDFCESGLMRAELLKDLQSPAPRILGNIQAELIIVSGQYILHYRDDHQQDQIKFLSEESVRLAFAGQDVVSGWLPENVKQWGVSARGTWMIQWIPPGKHTLTLHGKGMPEEPITVPLPALVFAGIGTSYYVWGAGERAFAPAMPLYHAPLPNLGKDGKICFGSNTPVPVSSKALPDMWKLFISSPFNSDLADNKSVNYPRDVRQQLCALVNKKNYPIRDLVPFKRYQFEGQATLEATVEDHFRQNKSL